MLLERLLLRVLTRHTAKEVLPLLLVCLVDRRQLVLREVGALAGELARCADVEQRYVGDAGCLVAAAGELERGHLIGGARVAVDASGGFTSVESVLGATEIGTAEHALDAGEAAA